MNSASSAGEPELPPGCAGSESMLQIGRTSSQDRQPSQDWHISERRRA